MIGKNEEKGEFDFIFGFEESCGYLGGDYVRDKDGVYGAMIVSEMAAYYKSLGKSLAERLDELYSAYGYVKAMLLSFEFEGVRGEEKISSLMKNFREKTDSIANLSVIEKIDYNKGIGELPIANVIELKLSGGHTVLIRPSGTEPKIKLYIFAIGNSKKSAENILTEIINSKELSL
jgi:phosphoglucomutase